MCEEYMNETITAAFSDSTEATAVFDLSNMQDRTLISRTQSGDHIAFEELVQK